MENVTARLSNENKHVAMCISILNVLYIQRTMHKGQTLLNVVSRVSLCNRNMIVDSSSNVILFLNENCFLHKLRMCGERCRLSNMFCKIRNTIYNIFKNKIK